jgi:hypothetical protein
MKQPKACHCALSSIMVVTAHANIAVAADLGCGFLECNSGCLVFRSDTGTTYRFAVAPTIFKGAHRVRITGTINASCTPLCSASGGCIEEAVMDSAAEQCGRYRRHHFLLKDGQPLSSPPANRREYTPSA